MHKLARALSFTIYMLQNFNRDMVISTIDNYDVKKALSRETLGKLMQILVQRRLLSEESDEYEPELREQTIPSGFNMKSIFDSDCVPTDLRPVCSDVPIFTITYLRSGHQSEREDEKKCRFPHERSEDGAKLSNDVQTKFSQRKTKLEKRQEVSEKIKRNETFKNDHREFMKNLKIKRINDWNERDNAAITIQRYLRGFSIRRNPKLDEVVKECYSEQYISELIRYNVDHNSKSINELFSCLHLKFGVKSGLKFDIDGGIEGVTNY